MMVDTEQAHSNSVNDAARLNIFCEVQGDWRNP